MHLAFKFFRPDSGGFNGWFGSDFRHTHLSGWVRREEGSDTINLFRFPIPVTIIAQSDHELTLSSVNLRNGCSCKFTMVPYEGERLPIWRKLPDSE